MSFSRRRFLTITAAACGCAALPAHAETQATWRGIALGAPASLRLVGITEDKAQMIFAAVEAELQRLEGIFSLYRSESALSRLNRDGFHRTPPADLLAVLALSDHLHKTSHGAFDPTVQPIFEVIAQATNEGRDPSLEDLDVARSKVGWDGIEFDTSQVNLRRDGAALTLNGIAQGYITDRIVDLLRSHDLTNALVDMGELRAQGYAADGQPWRAGIQAPSGEIATRVTFSARALATSAPFGTQFGASGHIFDPKTGTNPKALEVVSVTAPAAALADGLSTALSVLLPVEHAAFMATFPDCEIVYRA
ncbi:FAD:protein FMN transferase [Roseovarius phycicola]|uniref:FAD:protein FMN transferase n=1 Tax=Roseovarius phycicola TaxID=3080976 RepID=A0ABZ2HBS5_9RHOB